MASQVDSAVIQRTKDTLGKVIKKPPLTDKLLNRPPFRYLHDIISEVSVCGSLSNWLVCINSSVGCVGLFVRLTNCSVSANNDLQGRSRQCYSNCCTPWLHCTFMYKLVHFSPVPSHGVWRGGYKTRCTRLHTRGESLVTFNWHLGSH